MKGFSNGFTSFLILASSAVAAAQVPLTNCAPDCQTLPLIVGFNDACDTDCQSGVMIAAGLEEGTSYTHLKGAGMVFLLSPSDAQLELVQANTTNVDFIECDQCVSIADAAYDPVCGSDSKTYANENDCGLKCRAVGDDSSGPSVVSIVHRGECVDEKPVTQPGQQQGGGDAAAIPTDSGAMTTGGTFSLAGAAAVVAIASSLVVIAI